MGRYKDLKELRGKRGLGRKARKQADPQLPRQVLEGQAKSPVPKVTSKIGGRIKQRARKKATRMTMLKAMQREKNKRRAAKRDELKTSDDGNEQTSDEEVPLLVERISLPFSDENQSWLKPTKSASKKEEGKAKSKKSVSFKKVDLLEGGSDGNGSEEEEKGMHHDYDNNYDGYLDSLLDFIT